jgi:hypothetical protein
VLQATIRYANSPFDVIDATRPISAKPIVVAAALFGSLSLGVSWWALFLPFQGSFNPSWPDAIKCMVRLPENTSLSPMVFYYQGISKARAALFDVARYFLVGGYNDAKGYAAHEIWFNSDHRLISVNKERNAVIIGDDKDRAIAKNLLDPISQRYLDAYLVEAIDCGGTSMDAIRRTGNAFYFAKP